MRRVPFALMPTGRRPAPPPPMPNHRQPRFNVYDCTHCGGSITVVYLCEGVTPMFLRCRANRDCRGTMQSQMHQGPHGEPTYCWRAATPKERLKAKRAGDGSFEHYRDGGLVLDRYYGDAAPEEGATPWTCEACGTQWEQMPAVGFGGCPRCHEKPC